MNEIGNRIRKRRLELGLSQEDISSPGFVSVPYISRIETGDIDPSPDALILIGMKLRVSALYLQTGDAEGHCFFCGRG